MFILQILLSIWAQEGCEWGVKKAPQWATLYRSPNLGLLNLEYWDGRSCSQNVRRQESFQNVNWYSTNRKQTFSNANRRPWPKPFTLVLRCNKLLTGFLAKGYLPRMSWVSHIYRVIVRMIMRWIREMCTDLLEFALRLTKTPEKLN